MVLNNIMSYILPLRLTAAGSQHMKDIGIISEASFIASSVVGHLPAEWARG